jgi:hypothetical protein
MELKEVSLVNLLILYSVNETEFPKTYPQSFTKDLMDSILYNKKMTYGVNNEYLTTEII